jgi:HEAT repeat protein
MSSVKLDAIKRTRRYILLEETVVEGLVNPDHRVRLRTIYRLVERGYVEAVPLLLSLLHDREMPVRSAAIVALGTLADQQAFDPLIACLAASMSVERKSAIEALVSLGDPRRRDGFLDALKTETDYFVRLKLIIALSAFPDDEVLDALLERLIGQEETICATAAIALGKMGQPRVIPALEQMALTDRGETSIHNLYTGNGYLAKKAIQMLLHPEQGQDIDWPDVVLL